MVNSAVGGKKTGKCVLGRENALTGITRKEEENAFIH